MLCLLSIFGKSLRDTKESALVYNGWAEYDPYIAMLPED